MAEGKMARRGKTKEGLPVFFKFGVPRIESHLRNKTDYLELMIANRTSSEDWFRVEILEALAYAAPIAILGTNHRVPERSGRADLWLSTGHGCRELYVELKVLPLSAHYKYAAQRFQSGKNNTKDFERLTSNERDCVVYIYWSDIQKWEIGKNSIESKYAIRCRRQTTFNLQDGVLVISFWTRLGARIA